MQGKPRDHGAGLILLALSLAAPPAQAEDVFTSVGSEACDSYYARLDTHGNWVKAHEGGSYCELPGDVVHWPDTTYFADSTADGRLYTWVGVEGNTGTSNIVGTAKLYQGAYAYAAGYAERSVEGVNSLEMAVSLTVDALTASSQYASRSSLSVLFERVPSCSDGSYPDLAGMLWPWVEVAPGPRRVVLSATCPPGRTLSGIVQAIVKINSHATAQWSSYVQATGAVRVHSVELTTR